MKKLIFIFIMAIFLINSCSKSQENIKVSSTNINIPLTGTNEMLAYINAIRIKGAKCAPPAPPLYLNSSLEAAATAHSKDMAANHFLRHEGSGTQFDVAKPKNALNSNFADRIVYFGYPVKPGLLIGENITFTKFKNVRSDRLDKNFKKAVNNWLYDEAHCKILMNPRFTYAGIGYQKAADRYYFTLDLAEKAPLSK